MQPQQQFEDIAILVRQAKQKIFHEANKTLIELYWQIGKGIFEKVENEGWGKSVVEDLGSYLLKEFPNSSGFSARNLWRMKQFYETYKENEKLSPLVTEISWTNNLLILSAAKTDEEREFYIRLTMQERYSKRELERQIKSAMFERVALSKGGQSPKIQSGEDLTKYGFRDHYMLEFLDLPDNFSEKDFKKAILKNLKKFILEFGKDFIFIDEEFRVQVGKEDYSIDLLFFHRELRCQVAIELKIDRFKPEYVGKMNFYLEALDRDFKKEHENPSVGIILCKQKEKEVVEYALSNSLSPTLVAEYETKLIDKDLLRKKLNEFYEKSLLEK